MVLPGMFQGTTARPARRYALTEPLDPAGEGTTPFGLSLSKPEPALRQAQPERGLNVIGPDQLSRALRLLGSSSSAASVLAALRLATARSPSQTTS